MRRRASPAFVLLLALAAIGLIASLGPRERTLGANVRIVYLHGAWVWTALIGYGLAAILGAAGVIGRRRPWQRLSLAWGRAATVFWVTYLPLSLWAMQANWNGLFLDEPRWRLGLDFAIIAVLLQISYILMGSLGLGAAINAGFFVCLLSALHRAEQVMHPPSPIASSGSFAIQAFFSLLVLLCLLAEWQLARWFDARPA
jgi:hypothetical protein